MMQALQLHATGNMMQALQLHATSLEFQLNHSLQQDASLTAAAVAGALAWLPGAAS